MQNSFTMPSVAAAAAKSLQLSDSVRLHRRQPTRLPRPWDSPGKNTGVGCHFLLQCRKVKSESEVAQSCPIQYRSHGLQPTRLHHPWDFPGKSTGLVPLPSPCPVLCIVFECPIVPAITDLNCNNSLGISLQQRIIRYYFESFLWDVLLRQTLKRLISWVLKLYSF